MNFETVIETALKAPNDLYKLIGSEVVAASRIICALTDAGYVVTRKPVDAGECGGLDAP